MQVNTFRYPEGLSRGVRRECPPLSSCFVPTVVSYPGHSYANLDDSYGWYNWFLRTHFVRGRNSFSSTQTAFHLYLWRNIESGTRPVSCLVKGAKGQMIKRHFTHARPRVSGALFAAVGSFIRGNDREILVPWTHRSHQETANEKSCYMMHSSQSAAVL